MWEGRLACANQRDMATATFQNGDEHQCCVAGRCAGRGGGYRRATSQRTCHCHVLNRPAWALCGGARRWSWRWLRAGYCELRTCREALVRGDLPTAAYLASLRTMWALTALVEAVAADCFLSALQWLVERGAPVRPQMVR